MSDVLYGASSGYSAKKKIVDQFPQGKRFECYVNPKDVTDAVITVDVDLDFDHVLSCRCLIEFYNSWAYWIT